MPFDFDLFSKINRLINNTKLVTGRKFSNIQVEEDCMISYCLYLYVFERKVKLSL